MASLTTLCQEDQMKTPKNMNTVSKFLGITSLSLAISGGAAFAHGAEVANNAATHTQHMHGSEAIVPTEVGQDIFAATQEIVRILEADPKTDWNKVNVAALREHLVDMNEIALRATA